MLTSGASGLSADDLPKTMPQFIELTDFLYRKAMNGAVEDHILDSLRMISDALDEDNYEVNFIPMRLCMVSLFTLPALVFHSLSSKLLPRGLPKHNFTSFQLRGSW